MRTAERLHNGSLVEVLTAERLHTGSLVAVRTEERLHNGSLVEVPTAERLHIIIIIIKKDWQCKAGRGRLTPYQSEDPSPTLPAYRGKEDIGKIYS